MHVVVSGAAGVLGSRVAINLSARHTVRGVDLRPVPPSVQAVESIQAVQADLTDPDGCARAVAGAEVVVHCASIHPWKEYADGFYWDLNVKATHHLLAACVAMGVKRVVLTSSVEPFGGRPFAPEELPVREDVTPAPRRLYGLTKQIGEEVAARFHRVDALCCIVLRPATFIPREEEHIGPRLLTGTWLYPEDVIAAHVLAVDAPAPPTGWEAHYIAPAVPYSAADVAATRRGTDEALAVYERHYPGVGEVFQRHGIAIPPLTVFYDIERPARSLGWRPRWGFADWLAVQRDAPIGQLRPSYDINRWLV
ncbi:MAG: NAD(P)-dependent oxidoreductase [Chloroflexota bacterium]|nr:MAG: NAD(P)-dependent oxidoreductase [Chloroflexota bacterium]